MITELLIHIGDPKTGTSSIQAAMKARAFECPSLRVVTQEETNGSAFANAVNPRKSNPERRREQFLKKADWIDTQSADLGLISAEFFASVPPEELSRGIAEFLPEQRQTTRILAYARPHAGRFLSSYAQRLKTGGYNGEPEGYAKNIVDGDKLNYASRFGAWESEFRERFTLRPFVRSEMVQGDAVADFFNQAFKGEAFTLKPMPRANEALAVQELAALRRVQTILTQHGIPFFLRMSFGGAMGRRMSRKWRRYDTKPHLSVGHVAYIRAACLEDAIETDRRFFPSGLMQRELEKACDTASADVQSFDVQTYYSARRIRKIDALAHVLAAEFTAFPLAWRSEYQRKRHQRFDRLEDQDDYSARAKSARKVWRLIDKLARLLVK